MAPQVGDGSQNSAPGRRVIYCIVPRSLASSLYDVLRGHFRDERDVEVIIEQRSGDRRAATERRGSAPAGTLNDRRRVRAVHGRRAGERRAAAVEVASERLPRRARRYADQLRFVEQVEPSTQYAEDVDTVRLVARIQGGDTDGFADLYMRYFNRVYGYLRIALRNHHDAEDAAQQVFISAYEALPRYEPREGHPFRAWLFVIARNHAIKQLKKLDRVEPMDPLDISAEAARGSEIDEGDVTALRWIVDPELLMLIERLPATQRQVLALRYMLGLRSSEVAEIMGCSSNHVSVLQYRALAFLRARLTALGRDPRRWDRTPMKSRFQQAPVLRWRRFALSP